MPVFLQLLQFFIRTFQRSKFGYCSPANGKGISNTQKYQQVPALTRLEIYLRLHAAAGIIAIDLAVGTLPQLNGQWVGIGPVRPQEGFPAGVVPLNRCAN